MTVDRFYGFQDTAELCEHVITSLFSVSSPTVEIGSDGLATPPRSPTSTSSAKVSSPPALSEFIAYALYRTRLPISITHQALLLLTRLKTRYPSARGTSTSPHRLFLSSLMLSSKISMDDTYSNKSWQVVGQGLFALREVNQMERELFAFLGWNVVVRDEELSAWIEEVVAPYELSRNLLEVDSFASTSSSPLVPTTSNAAATLPSSSSSSIESPPRRSMEDRKRRRDTSAPSPTSSSSTSRSPSPDSIRHKNASDAAIAILQGGHSSTSTSSFSGSKASTSNGALRRPRSSYSVHRTQTSYSSSSSSLSSPVSGSMTPGSPNTPPSAGPLTPDQNDTLAPPAWVGFTAEKKEGAKGVAVVSSGSTSPVDFPVDSIRIAAW